MIRVAINGFGRIGRTVTRQLVREARHADIEIALVNDVAVLESCAYLFRYDSAFGPFPGRVEAGRDTLAIDGRRFPFTRVGSLRALDLSGIDVVLDCTGRVRSREVAEAALEAGAGAVLISGPAGCADATVVIGANEDRLGDARIVSNASCTTNAIAPLLQRLDGTFGIERAHVTTVHCYTGAQPTVDAPGQTPERSRAAAVSMIPTTTSARGQLDLVLPRMRGRLSVAAVRVPCLSVSAVDATLRLAAPPEGDVEDLARTTVEGSPVLGVTEDPCVSTDMRARPESLVVALRELQQAGGDQLRLFGWYDNEWGFSARMIDMVRLMAGRGARHAEERGPNARVRQREANSM